MSSKKQKKRSSFSIIILFVCTTILGLALLPLLPVKLNSSRRSPGLSVSFSMSHASARIVEMEITSKLEGVLNRLEGVTKVSSSSDDGCGSVYLTLDRHVNLDEFRFEVSTLIRQIWPQLPETARYPTISMSRPDKQDRSAFYSFVIRGPRPVFELKKFAEKKIKPPFSLVEGIEKVTFTGGVPLEWQLEYNYAQLKVLGISPTEIGRAISDCLKNVEFLGCAQTVNSCGDTLGIRVALVPDLNLKTAGFDPKKIVVKKLVDKKTKMERIVRLDELVSVRYKRKTPDTYYRVNGFEQVACYLYARDEANQIALGKQVKELLKRVERSLPDAYVVETTYDATRYLKKELNKIYFRSGLSLLILLLFVLLISRSMRYFCLVAVTMVVNIATALIFYYWFGVEIQLYSLAGITISLGLVMDNTIVMADHLLKKKNKKVILAILAATLTTIASLSVIFFLEESFRLVLQDFALVMIINLSLSLFVALFLVPALVDKLGLEEKRKRSEQRFPVLRRKVRLRRCYRWLIELIYKWRVAVVLFLILSFGIPFFLLPTSLEETSYYYINRDESFGVRFYNKTIGSVFYQENIKPFLVEWMGGTFQLFMESSSSASFSSKRYETIIYIEAKTPYGSTLDQTDFLIQEMEREIEKFPEVKLFETRVSSRNATIQIYFKEQFQRGHFPSYLKKYLTSLALDLGGASWVITGQGDAFNNELKKENGTNSIKLLGYNYDDLMALAVDLKKELSQYRRVKDVTINSQKLYYKSDAIEYRFQLKKKALARLKISPQEFFSFMQDAFQQNKGCVANFFNGEEYESFYLNSVQSKFFDSWNFKNVLRPVLTTKVQVGNVAKIDEEKLPQNIKKENQQYILVLQYRYVGDSSQKQTMEDRVLKRIYQTLPLGYRIVPERYHWQRETEQQNKQYLLLFLVAGIIFFICSILFNSLRQPFVVLYLIPLSFIGIFLTFSLFELNFDKGGFASFILLSGVTVNASIYILNDYNNLKKRFPRQAPIQLYLKAFNGKIIPILLTVISTILGFIPFLVGSYQEPFWSSLAAGTIGGLSFSLLIIVLFLPLFNGIGKRDRKEPQRKRSCLLVLRLKRGCLIRKSALVKKIKRVIIKKNKL